MYIHSACNICQQAGNLNIMRDFQLSMFYENVKNSNSNPILIITAQKCTEEIHMKVCKIYNRVYVHKLLKLYFFITYSRYFMYTLLNRTV